MQQRSAAWEAGGILYERHDFEETHEFSRTLARYIDRIKQDATGAKLDVIKPYNYHPLPVFVKQTVRDIRKCYGRMEENSTKENSEEANSTGRASELG